MICIYISKTRLYIEILEKYLDEVYELKKK
jgi:hypothetical protein